jgi:hypothetical protein
MFESESSTWEKVAWHCKPPTAVMSLSPRRHRLAQSHRFLRQRFNDKYRLQPGNVSLGQPAPGRHHPDVHDQPPIPFHPVQQHRGSVDRERHSSQADSNGRNVIQMENCSGMTRFHCSCVKAYPAHSGERLFFYLSGVTRRLMLRMGMFGIKVFQPAFNRSGKFRLTLCLSQAQGFLRRGKSIIIAI